MSRNASGTICGGIYPTMITPYTEDDRIDEEALILLVRWYRQEGCHGLFAACQSSEIFYLSLKERVRIVETVAKEAKKLSRADAPFPVVASGHISDSPEEQAEELLRMDEAGCDAVVLISNRLDISQKGTAAWIRDLERLLDRLPSRIRLGIYESPYPYKRLLNEDMLKALRDCGRFAFIKDTCCDPLMLRERLKILEGSDVKLFNANAQTLLLSLRSGGSGYCGVMANFHPHLYAWLYEHSDSERAETLQELLSMAAFTESLSYPVTAKYYLRRYAGLPLTTYSRSCRKEPSAYDIHVLEQLHSLTDRLSAEFLKNEES